MASKVLWVISGLLTAVAAQDNSTGTLAGQNCAPRLLDLISNGTDIPLLDKQGQPTKDQSAAWVLWNRVRVGVVGRFLRVIHSMAAALTAQLPYEARSLGPNVMAFFMAVGSPALITYSLTITVLNNQWIYHRFGKLIEVNDQARHDIRSRLRAARFIMQQCQGVPIQIIQGSKGWLSSVVVLPANKEWFERLLFEVESTSRPITFSLATQVIWTILAYLFTIVQAFTTSGSGTDLGLSMSSGAVWLWMIPVILGWVVVGTQSSHKSVHRALRNSNKEIWLATPDPDVQLHGAESGALGAGTAIIDRRIGAHAHLMHYEKPSVIISAKEESIRQRSPTPVPGAIRRARTFSGDGVPQKSSGVFRSFTDPARNISDTPNSHRGNSDGDRSPRFQHPPRISGSFRASDATYVSTSDMSSADSKPRRPSGTEDGELDLDLPPIREKSSQDFGGRSIDDGLERGDFYGLSQLFSSSSLPSRNSDYSKVFGFRIAGDEEEAGPIYNYARVWSTPHAISHFLRAFSNLTKRLNSPVGLRVDGQPWIPRGAGADTNLIGTDAQVARYVGLRLGDDLDMFPKHWPDGCSWRVALASMMAILIQWGTTGSGVLTAYLIPVAGLSCRSGSWILYGVAGTIIWLLLVLSSALSARWSRLNWIRLRSSDTPPPPPLSVRVLGISAVTIRMVGKTFAVVNTFWILLTSFFEFTGFFSRCWCDAVVLHLGKQKGWMLVFPSSEVIAKQSTAALAGGLAMSTTTMILAGTFFIMMKTGGR